MDPDEIVVPDVGVRWRHRWSAPALWGSAFAFVIVAGAMLGMCALVGSTLLLLLTAVVAGRSLRAERLMTLRITPAGLRVTDSTAERTVATADMERALVLTQGEVTTLVIELKGWRQVELRLPQLHEEGLPGRCIERLNLGPNQRVAEFRNPVGLVRLVVSWVLGAMFGGVLALIVREFGNPWPTPLLEDAVFYGLWAATIYATGRATRTVDLVVGADGIELRGPWRRRYIPYASLYAMAWEPPGTLLIHERGLRPRRLGGTSLIEDASTADAFLTAVQQAQALYARRHRETELARLLVRGGRTLAAWREALRQLAEGGAAYRAQALGAEELALLLDDASADEEVRLGAALALRALRPTEEPTRIRVAAGTCANPTMREALERVADDSLDDAALAAVKRR